MNLGCLEATWPLSLGYSSLDSHTGLVPFSLSVLCVLPRAFPLYKPCSSIHGLRCWQHILQVSHLCISQFHTYSANHILEFWLYFPLTVAPFLLLAFLSRVWGVGICVGVKSGTGLTIVIQEIATYSQGIRHKHRPKDGLFYYMERH